MSQDETSTNLDGVIARSRSRYRSNRSTQNTTSPLAPPKIRPDLLRQHNDVPRSPQEVRGLDQRTEANRFQDTTSGFQKGKVEDGYNDMSTPFTNDRPTGNSSAALNQRARTVSGHKGTQSQTTQYESRRRVDDPGRNRIGSYSAEDEATRVQRLEQGPEEGGHVQSRELGAERRVLRTDYVKPSEAYKRTGTQQDDESHYQSKPGPSNSPPMASNNFYAEQRLPHTSSTAVSSKPATLQKRSLTHRRKASNVRDELKRSISAPMPVEPPEVTNKPAFDAPVSAVNAGDRRIRVQYDQTPLSIAVTPSTTPLDILSEAGSQLGTQPDATTNVLMECFKQLGLERPLRRYERIRDVMNSWDHDSQNSLSIVPSPTEGNDRDLDLNSVSTSQPGDTSVHIYHSNSPGSWDKRWITLRSDGQVVMTKKDGKENVNICHISDFDIYVPTKRQLTKKIKPPKKYCFAVKSQQKSAMFLTTENFVHFFAAGDRELAMAWYKAVQEWRSWYLVNVMGEGQKAAEASSISQRPGAGSQSDGPKSKTSMYQTHQQQSPSQKQRQQPLHNSVRSPSKNPSSMPLSVPKKLNKDAQSGMPTTGNEANYRASIIHHQPLISADPEPFTAQGLLGRSYTQRQKAVASGTNERMPEYGPPAYHNGNAPTLGNDGLQRRPTQRHLQQPLLDLTPKRMEAPQHRKKGNAHVPDHLPFGGLIEAATNTDPTVTNPLETRGTESRKPSAGLTQTPASTQCAGSPEKHGPAFTGGLLSSMQRQGQDGAGTGHGVKTGNRAAKEPLLDMTMEGPWAKGSLLDRVNSGESGRSGPQVDREKRREMDAPVGEGM